MFLHALGFVLSVRKKSKSWYSTPSWTHRMLSGRQRPRQQKRLTDLSLPRCVNYRRFLQALQVLL